MILLVGFYKDASDSRTAEFIECIRRNTANEQIEGVKVFIEERISTTDAKALFPDLAHPKVHLIEFGKRVCFSDFFDFANRHLSGVSVIVANTDIYFDETLALLVHEPLAGKMLCLSRWEESPEGNLWHFAVHYSQDAWIFEAPLPVFEANIPLGKPGCENRLAYEAERAGLKVSNPSASLRARHLHNSCIRRYSEAERIRGPVRYVPVSVLNRADEFKSFPSHRGLRTQGMIQARCHEIEVSIAPHFDGKIPRRIRREIFLAISARIQSPPRPAADCPMAAVAFKETMGYTLAHLEFGVSTHNNDPRPVEYIPAKLEGMQFTQVVAYNAAPVEVEFVTSGRLYVLAAHGWEGYAPAAAFLDDAGWREPDESLRTENGPEFDLWSLCGDAGERLVIPTQVMLVSKELIPDGTRRIQLNDANGDRTATPNTGPRIEADTAAGSILAITSLSPAAWRLDAQRVALRSWRKAGLRVVSLNHSSEIEAMASLYNGIEWVAIDTTAVASVGNSVPIHAALELAAMESGPVMLINSDIQLRLSPWELRRLRWLSDGGLCYFVRHNHEGDLAAVIRETHGIDAFLFRASDAGRFEQSMLGLGQPFWDYLLPHRFATSGREIFAIEFPAAFHLVHPQQWTRDNWQQCAIEFGRLTDSLDGDQSMEACRDMARRIRSDFEREKIALPPKPLSIREWVEKTFSGSRPKVFFELGSHKGGDTPWLAAIEGVTLHAFEPDPRNIQPARGNVVQNFAAVGERDGRAPFILSKNGWGTEWTHSSSLRTPKNHLNRYPVTFGDRVEVEVIALDTYCRNRGIESVDFIWADIQGAEGDMIRGGRDMLSRTRYLFTEFSDNELYEGQIPLREILALLPGFRVIEMWKDDVLLENQRMKSGLSPV